MDFLENIKLGIETAFTFDALLFCFVGVFVGTFVGALPGIGPLVTISIALPLTFGLDPTVALIMLAGIFYGAQYGGSITSVLLNLPGTASTAITALDGYPMTKGGRAGLALFVNAVASFIGGSLAILVLMAFAPAIARIALSFHSAEYFAIMLLGLIAASTLSGGSTLKSLVMVTLGLILGLVGMDLNSGAMRYTFGVLELTDGVSLIAIAMGLFGVAEIINKMATPPSDAPKGSTQRIPFKEMIPSRAEFSMLWAPVLRGSAVGTVVGALPGAGPTIAAFMSYAFEKRVSRTPERFGKGAIEGVAAPEAANNASVQSAFIPTLSLGIPGDVVMAVLLGAMMLHGIVPGPQFITNEPAMFWGLIVSFWIGNVMLLILSLPLIGIWVRIITIPDHFLMPGIMFFICMGAYSINNSVFDVFVTLIFGIVGYLFMVFNFHPAPVLLGFVLGPLMEENLRRSLIVARGDPMVFLERPISLSLLLMSAILLLWPLIKLLWNGSTAAKAKSVTPP